MQTFEINSLADWLTYREHWNRLSSHNPMLSMEWLEPWWRHFGKDHELAIIGVTDGTQPVGFAPLYKHASSLGAQIRLLGTDVVCSDYVSAVVDESCESEAYRSLSNHMAEASLSGRWRDIRSIQFDAMSVEDRWLEHLNEFARSSDCDCRFRPMVSSWRLSLPGSWNELLASQRGHNVQRKARKAIARIESGEFEFETISTMDKFSFGMSHLIRLHQARRRSVGDVGCFSNPLFESFLRSAVAGLIDVGRASINLCHWDGKTIAAQLLLNGDNIAHMYQSGVDPEALKVEPGHMIVAASVKRSIDNGIKHFDFLRGDEEYKEFWQARPIALKRFIFTPPTLQARAIDLVHQKLSWLRSCMPDLSAFSPISK